MSFLDKIFSKKKSQSVAKERLQLVLINDRSDISPEVLERLREDLISVISSYMEIDTEHIEMDFDREGKKVALVANIPVTNIRRGQRGKKDV
ncbi:MULTISPECIES: cell division topological specificity factor MinE [Dethiosulfovibrio]|jgi:cell division topological specificity factor|uniref:Cell division topological specificity factor n=2 Tax=Dethiosulfovibrio TaxID=47054 RepID=A0ABS9EJW1_9BACT|nr:MULTISPECIES: cell division topological specificity factor MinE [Dethiosulfovibrio]MCF4112986.1 cell division topological specificity factor MinE [Dethiosulfovibrio russensis]MCF4141450.1 cell division topological specificity factor MinE [Dethiosulfovibrio marinus]MCF4144406.1 cell division topological specificity factor MinE [Dethiosulfovibrio acidaminovorans]